MAEPATLALELLILVVAAGSLAASGVLATLLLPRRWPTTPRPSVAPESRRAGSEFGLAVVGLTLGFVLGVAVLARLLPVAIGSPMEFDLALGAGAAGGLAVSGWACVVTLLSARSSPDDLSRPDPRPPTRRGWVAATAITAGAGGSGLLTLIGLYLALGGHVPTMIAAPLGAGIVALATRVRGGWGHRGASDSAGEMTEGPSTEELASLSMHRASDLYLAFLFAAVGAALLAFVPSVVRILHPNAVLFPIAALSVVFVAGLVAVIFGGFGSVPVPTHRRIAVVAIGAFASIAALAIVPPYLDGSAGLFASALVGPVAGVAIVLALTSGKAPIVSTGASSLSSIGRASAPVLTLTVALFLAFRFGSGALLGGGGVTDPNLGAYGLGLASVSFVGIFGGLVALDLAGHLTRAIEREADPAIAPVRRANDRALAESLSSDQDFSSASGTAAVVAASLGTLVLLLGALEIVPLELGQSPVALADAVELSAPGLLVALVLGLLLPILGLRLVAGSLPREEGPARPAAASIAIRTVPALGPIGLAIGAPLLVGWALGISGLLGLGVGVALGTLALDASSAGFVLDRASWSSTAPTLILTIVTSVAFAGGLLAAAFTGRI